MAKFYVSWSEVVSHEALVEAENPESAVDLIHIGSTEDPNARIIWDRDYESTVVDDAYEVCDDADYRKTFYV